MYAFGSCVSEIFKSSPQDTSCTAAKSSSVLRSKCGANGAHLLRKARARMGAVDRAPAGARRAIATAIGTKTGMRAREVQGPRRGTHSCTGVGNCLDICEVCSITSRTRVQKVQKVMTSAKFAAPQAGHVRVQKVQKVMTAVFIKRNGEGK